MDDDPIQFRGMTVIRSWPERIRAAQEQTDYLIAGLDYDRVRYGDEDPVWGTARYPCRDCAVIEGEFHVPGCAVERCPKCAGQAMCCDCAYDKEYDPNLN
jgi:hypothetical protein